MKGSTAVLLYRAAQRLRRAWIVALIAAGWLAPGTRGAESEPQALAQALQRKYDTVRDFSTDFVHSYQGGVLRKTLAERDPSGTILHILCAPAEGVRVRRPEDVLLHPGRQTGLRRLGAQR